MKKIFWVFCAICIASCAIAVFLSVFSSRVESGTMSILDNNGTEMARSESGTLIFSDDQYEDNVDNVINEAVTIISKTDKKFDRQRLLNSEIIIYTEFDSKAFDALNQALYKMEKTDGRQTEAAITTVDGRLIASAAFADDSRAVTVPHKPGSAIKPLSVYAPAIENGTVNWASELFDSPFKMIVDDGNERGWPANYDGTYLRTNVGLEYAISHSLNTVAVKVLDMLSPLEACEFLEKLGIEVESEKQTAEGPNYTDAYGSLALGELKNGVKAEQLAAAYQIFANGGSYTRGHCIKSIETSKGVEYSFEEKSIRVISEETCEIMYRLLEKVVEQGGTAANARIEGIKVVGKTGTSQEHRDNWFVGVTPDYSCAVWYGYDTAVSKRNNNDSIEVFTEAVKSLEHKTADFPKSKGLIEAEYCIYSGQLASDNCKKTQVGYFKAADIPEICAKHKE